MWRDFCILHHPQAICGNIEPGRPQGGLACILIEAKKGTESLGIDRGQNATYNCIQ